MAKLFTVEALHRLKRNGEKTRKAQNAEPFRGEPDHVPVVKIFNPCGAATWLLTEINPEDEDKLFGLCDLGRGFPELDYVSRKELEDQELERDRSFSTDHPLTVWLEAAQLEGRITEDETALEKAAAKLERPKSNHAAIPAALKTEQT